MANARLTEVTIERFKSHKFETVIPTGALTVLIGRNNSGKSSVVQALLLLKQTLESPRSEVPLALEGIVEAFSIRELTYGWPTGDRIDGPRFKVRWKSDVQTQPIVQALGASAISVIQSFPEMAWFGRFLETKFFPTETELTLEFGEDFGSTVLRRVKLCSFTEHGAPIKLEFIRGEAGEYVCHWNGVLAKKIRVTLDHFIPYISIDRRNVGPRDRQRAWVNIFSALLSQPLDDLRSLLRNFNYLSSARAHPPSLYKFSSVPPDDMGLSGETAAQLLQANKDREVAFVMASSLYENGLPKINIAPFQAAVNKTLADFGIEPTLRIEEIKDVGFRLFFGQATLQHVGRGLTYLLPIVELGLMSDPILFRLAGGAKNVLEEANARVCAFEEPEAHLHPKIQSRLAEWFVALAMSKRQIFVETHSDHLVRRLRSLIATAKAGSMLERTLANEVVVVEVEQVHGVSQVTSGHLCRDGGLEKWPAEFMEQAIDAEQEIYVASIDKPRSTDLPKVEVVHEDSDEP